MPSSPSRHRALALAVPFLLILAACGASTDPIATSTSGSARSDGTTLATVTPTRKTVSFVQPGDGATVAGGVPVTMTAEGITIEKAGEVRDGAGHFHVIIDAGCMAPEASIPLDASHVHLGTGQSKATIYLEPGPHKLCLQAGDGTHVALDATDTITLDVGINDRNQWCAVVGETTKLFDTNDDDKTAFSVRQAGYENARRLVAQLSEALDHVDDSVREDVARKLDFVRKWASGYIEAGNYEEAAAALAEVFEKGDPTSGGPGSAWILSKCGVAA